MLFRGRSDNWPCTYVRRCSRGSLRAKQSANLCKNFFNSRPSPLICCTSMSILLISSSFTRSYRRVVIVFLSPPCAVVLSTLFNVPGARSSLRLPAIVTKPGFSLCLNWRWLPFVLTMNQPSSSIILMTALTFIYRMISDLSRLCKEKHIADLICLRGQRILVPLRWMRHKPFAGRTLRVAEE